MLKTVILIGITALLSTCATSHRPQPRDHATGVGTIRGQVTESDNGEPIFAPSVMIKGTKMGAMGDTLGVYKIARVPAGTYIVIASALAHKSTKIPNIRVSADSVTTLNIKLAKDPHFDVNAVIRCGASYVF